MAMEGSTLTNESNRSQKPVCLIWGCMLNGENPTYTFEMPAAWSFEEQLTLRTNWRLHGYSLKKLGGRTTCGGCNNKICLGDTAKDEFNIVEIVPPKDSKDSTPVHIATLKLSVLPMVTLAGFDLTPPVTFRLKTGLGPVYLAGQHVTDDLHWETDAEEEVSSQEEEEMEEKSFKEKSFKEKSPAKPAKRLPNKPVAISVQDQSLGKGTSRGRKPVTRGELRL